jgi:hypothetical protein
VVIAEPRFPAAIQGRHFFAQPIPNAELDGMPLAIVETDRFHAPEALQCPGKTDR